MFERHKAICFVAPFLQMMLVCTRISLCLQDLFAAGEGKFGTDEETLIKIIGNRSAEHLRKGEHLIAPWS